MPDLDLNLRARQVCEAVVFCLFGDGLIPARLIPVLARAIVESCPDLRVASVDEMSAVYDLLCAALFERNAEKLHGVIGD
jgi:hypothetical protein